MENEKALEIPTERIIAALRQCGKPMLTLEEVEEILKRLALTKMPIGFLGIYGNINEKLKLKPDRISIIQNEKSYWHDWNKGTFADFTGTFAEIALLKKLHMIDSLSKIAEKPKDNFELALALATSISDKKMEQLLYVDNFNDANTRRSKLSARGISPYSPHRGRKKGK